jgi:hypothetical protein
LSDPGWLGFRRLKQRLPRLASRRWKSSAAASFAEGIALVLRLLVVVRTIAWANRNRRVAKVEGTIESRLDDDHQCQPFFAKAD